MDDPAYQKACAEVEVRESKIERHRADGKFFPCCPACGKRISFHPCRETTWHNGERLEIGYWMGRCWSANCDREWIDPLEFFQ